MNTNPDLNIHNPADKLPYTPPTFKSYGTITAITQTAGGGSDGTSNDGPSNPHNNSHDYQGHGGGGHGGGGHGRGNRGD